MQNISCFIIVNFFNYTTCKMKKNILVENEQLKDEITELKTTTSKQLEELREQIKELLNKNCKMHYKTLQKINNNGNMNTGTINNTISKVFKMIDKDELVDELLSVSVNNGPKFNKNN